MDIPASLWSRKTIYSTNVSIMRIFIKVFTFYIGLAKIIAGMSGLVQNWSTKYNYDSFMDLLPVVAHFLFVAVSNSTILVVLLWRGFKTLSELDGLVVISVRPKILFNICKTRLVHLLLKLELT